MLLELGAKSGQGATFMLERARDAQIFGWGGYLGGGGGGGVLLVYRSQTLYLYIEVIFICYCITHVNGAEMPPLLTPKIYPLLV